MKLITRTADAGLNMVPDTHYGIVGGNEVQNGLLLNGEYYTTRDLGQYDDIYLNRRTRKVLSWHFQRRLVREAGDILEGDYSRIPEYELVAKPNNFLPGHYIEGGEAIDIFLATMNVRRARRPRTDLNVIGPEVKAFNARFK